MDLKDPRLKSQVFDPNSKDDVEVGKAARKEAGMNPAGMAKAPPNHMSHTTNQFQNTKSSVSD